MNFISGKIYRYGMVGFLLTFALIEAGIFLIYIMTQHYVFKRTMLLGSEPLKPVEPDHQHFDN